MTSSSINVPTEILSEVIYCNTTPGDGFDLTIMCNICVNPNVSFFRGEDIDHIYKDWIGEAITHMVEVHSDLFY